MEVVMIIVLILLGALVVLFATRLLSRTVKIITKIALIMIILLGIITLFAYKDIMDMKEGIIQRNNTFFLYEDNAIYTAVTLKPVNSTVFSLESFGYLTEEELEEAESSFRDGEYEKMMGNNYKIFFLTPKILNRSYSLNITAELDEEELLAMIESERPFSIVAKKLTDEYKADEKDLELALERSYDSAEKMKGYIFAALLINYFQDINTSIVNDLKSKDLMIYPEGFGIGLIKHVPWI